MRNLLGRLLERSPTDLDRIATFWNVDLGGRDRYADVATIYRTMTDVWAVRDIWESLSEDSLELVAGLRESGDDGLTPDEAAAAVHMPEEQATEELRRLYAASIVALADTPGDEPDTGDRPRRLYLPREVALVFARVEAEHEQPLDGAASLDDLLGTVPFAEIEDAASRWGARVTPGIYARSELVNIIRKQLERPERVDRYISNLSGPARDVWAALRRAGGVLPLEELLPEEGYPGATRRRILRELSDPLLVWHSYAQVEDRTQRLLVIPRAILSPAVPEPSPAPVLEVAEAGGVLEPEWVFPQSGAWDLLTILREVSNSGPRWNALVESDPSIHRRFQNRLWRSDREIGEIPIGYITFLTRIGAMLGVLQDHDTRAVPGPEARSWRESAFTTAARKMVMAWTAAESWVEGVSRIDLTLYGASWPAFRAALLRAFGGLEEDLWYDQESFVDRLLHTEPDLLREAQVGAVGSSQLAMRLDQHRESGSRREDVLRLIVDATIETACVWLNLIERSHEMRSRRPVIRLTPFGNWIAGPRSEPSGQHIGPAPLAVGANFQVLLYRPTPRRIWALSAFAELKALDRVSIYTLTAPALVRALAGGVDLADVIRFLERQSGQELPQTVRYTLEEWDRGYRRIWMRRAVFLAPEEGEDSKAIAAALQDAGLDPEILPDGRIALIYDAADAGERLYSAASRALRDRGFAPLSGADTGRRGSRE